MTNKAAPSPTLGSPPRERRGGTVKSQLSRPSLNSARPAKSQRKLLHLLSCRHASAAPPKKKTASPPGRSPPRSKKQPLHLLHRQTGGGLAEEGFKRKSREIFAGEAFARRQNGQSHMVHRRSRGCFPCRRCDPDKRAQLLPGTQGPAARLWAPWLSSSCNQSHFNEVKL